MLNSLFIQYMYDYEQLKTNLNEYVKMAHTSLK